MTSVLARPSGRLKPTIAHRKTWRVTNAEEPGSIPAQPRLGSVLDFFQRNFTRQLGTLRLALNPRLQKMAHAFHVHIGEVDDRSSRLDQHHGRFYLPIQCA